MERGSDKHGPKLDEELKEESHSLETSSKESRVEGHKEKEDTGEESLGGSGSSAEARDEEGGSSHPRPKDEPGSDTSDR
jgi:hypothetical protein